jgi:hypothetical protein
VTPGTLLRWHRRLVAAKRSTKIRICYRGAPMLFYPAALPLSAQTLTYVAGIVRRYRRQIFTMPAAPD